MKSSSLAVAICVLAFLFSALPGTAEDQAPPPSGAVPAVDSQGGGKTKSTGIEIVKRFQEGGNVMWFLLMLSVVFLTYTFERSMNLRRSKIAPDILAEQADALWKKEMFGEVEALGEKSQTVLGKILIQLVKHRHQSLERLHTIAGDVGAREMRLQLQRAYPLAVAATIAPLFGLLGTVSGMVDAFDTVALAGSMGNPALLADSISKAMVATGAGLVVAIPSLGAYHFFKGKTVVFAIELEETVGDLMSEWFAGSPTAKAIPPRPASQPRA